MPGVDGEDDAAFLTGGVAFPLAATCCHRPTNPHAHPVGWPETGCNIITPKKGMQERNGEIGNSVFYFFFSAQLGGNNSSVFHNNPHTHD